MKVSGRFVISDIYISDKGSSYLTLVDLEDGGMVKVSQKGVSAAKIGSIVRLEATIKGRLKEGGAVSLDIVGGTMVAE